MTTELFDLSGKTALVTGSSQGIGFALARGLATAGARVVLNGRSRDKLDAAVKALTADGLDVHGQAFDVTDATSVAQAVADVQADLGPIDILVNNAGITRRVSLEDAEESVWREVLDTNLNSVFLVSRAVVKGMIERRRGKIINTCSLMSEVGRPSTGIYTASKGGVKMLTKAMCVDWAGHNIQINGIGPGYFLTELTRPLSETPEFDQWLRKRTPAGRWGNVEELVGTAIFLSSAASDFVNGQIIYVDGGVLASL